MQSNAEINMLVSANRATDHLTKIAKLLAEYAGKPDPDWADAGEINRVEYQLRQVLEQLESGR